ncbi:cobalamin biosynthesis protein CobN [Thalassospira profundimaris]|uniref:Cobaltochelatase subunit CobN n=1 Tax=Thalassospira profundimaris TaxID=502049 RepID=A0A367XJK4_9PROT|nr:cobaltochelatase subunit CobN [Thalassospira profundimaris]RCK53843.1 cobalamin biosynthesis protein CobN [Thalassospira profundimaris]
MHLLAAQPGMITDGSEAVDLGQSPGDVVILSAAESELACLATAQGHLNAEFPGKVPSLRLASLLQLGHNMSVDLYIDDVVSHARFIIVRVLGGRGYWEYGIEQFVALARERDIPLLLLPGDDQPDAELLSLSTVKGQAWQQVWRYLVEGGPGNAENLLRYVYEYIDAEPDNADPGIQWHWQPPAPLVKAGLYWSGKSNAALPDLAGVWQAGKPVVAVVFYRALIQAGNLDVIDAVITSLARSGLNALPVFVSSLKDPVAAALVADWLAETQCDLILNTTGFALAVPGALRGESPFDAVDAPVMQVVLSGGSESAWHDGVNGLAARDIAMNVALPEVDGRIFSRAISFKGSAGRDVLTEIDLVKYIPVPNRVDFVAQLAANWVRLRQTPAPQKRVAMVMANYPNRDARLGNGVGLDTPAGMITTLKAMQAAGYDIASLPANGDALIDQVKSGPTNDFGTLDQRDIRITLPLADYKAAFDALPVAIRDQVSDRWGTPESDPFYRTDKGGFALSIVPMGNVVVGLQPARGYNIDPLESYHSPDLVPPHNYFAFYIWLRHSFDAHAIIHFGKHGNMEWLPGKSLALSDACFPEAVFGPTPHLYPFIVNDPGEGTQAKRRAQAVIIDHLTPPLTRAESYGPLKDMEALVDEYYDAAAVDPRRLALLKRDILELAVRIGLDRDCGIETGEDEESALAKLDNYLCELKELQIRDGLHIFGEAPEGRLLTDLLIALARLPRGVDRGKTASLQRALVRDLMPELTGEMAFDPLDCIMGDAWYGPKPAVLCAYDGQCGPWRTLGDTVERLEVLAYDLVAGEKQAGESWQHTQDVLCDIETSLRPTITQCGTAELAGILRGLAGQFVEPGPSGAPTRGRPDVLPTGRNFYSVDTRTVPTPAAWHLGWKSAELLLERHVQEHGEWPSALGLSVWGTSNMRTGGDDIAQAMALMGVKPTWDSASRRVTGFEVLPLSLLGRPRIDITLRISGFFRDAFPGLIDLFDSAVRAVAALEDEPADMNPIAARVRDETERLCADGMAAEQAGEMAAFRVFGSKPGAYGAGLQAMIDEKLWEDEADLANAYLAWGSYAYGNGASGTQARRVFETRLGAVDAIVHNQDNREHDLLDSDDYYQFEGGMTSAVRHLSGQQPVIYHNDHSRPESPKIRTLNEEIARVVRARVVNPKWISGVMRHGYKGAFEMAATVDYLFAFAATARCVADHHFDLVYDAYLGDDTVRDFIADHNPDALKDIRDRLAEAIDRGLWQPRRNSVTADLMENINARSSHDPIGR